MDDGLTNEQTEKVLQLQDLTGIEDMSICRDVLIRHQWDLEVSNAVFMFCKKRKKRKQKCFSFNLLEGVNIVNEFKAGWEGL